MRSTGPRDTPASPHAIGGLGLDGALLDGEIVVVDEQWPYPILGALQDAS